VERLENLRTLSLYQNKLTELEGIGNFQSLLHLTEVNLGKNELSTLPEEFSTLTQVKSLWLEVRRFHELISISLFIHFLREKDNLFDHFPKQLIELVNLESLRISNNKIEVLPGNISVLSKLQVLAIGASHAIFVHFILAFVAFVLTVNG
jgi:Leucine-rich repeat (LRR) protein